MGEDRALVRLGAPPRRLRDRVGAAGAAARRAPHRRAAGAGGLLPQAEAVERSGAACWRATPSASRAGAARGGDPAGAGRHLRDAARRRDAGDGRLPARARHRRALHRRDQRARAAVPPHAGLGSPGRGAGQEVAGRRRHRAGDQAAAAGRRAVGGPAGRQRPRRRGLQRGAVGRSAEPAGADRARRASTRRPGGWRSTSRTSSTGSRSRRPRRIASRSTRRWRRSGSRASPSPIAPPRCWRRSCSSTSATRRRTAISSASIGRSASGSRWSTPTASTWR